MNSPFKIVVIHELSTDQKALLKACEDLIDAHKSLFGYAPYSMTPEKLMQHYRAEACQ